MSDVNGTVAIVVGVVAAASSIVVGLIGARQNRRDDRDNIRRDVELLALLPENLPAHLMMKDEIDRAVRELVSKHNLAYHRFMLLFSLSLGAGAMAALAVISMAKQPDGIEDVLAGVAIVCIFVAVFNIAARGRQLNKEEQRLAAKYPQPSNSSSS
ncbi:hypothetical protein PXH69_03380 [Rhodococcus qingshengii]|uniref:DUF2721 domain-containing protein n=1 Tax=Rhodococcus qingshengii TaxID=334542 RepID=A0AAW6LFI0_RHOSG|nr:hypothetical protein [Rhodococcus qingshengii]MDE8643975.1 hypothetical protein [Rhodococcus qingshengii]